MALRLLLTVAPLLTGCYAIHTNVNIHSNAAADAFADSGMQSHLYAAVTFASSGVMSIVETLGTGAGDPAVPEWCKNDTQLSWKQRKSRMQQRATLDWARMAMQKMIKYNETVPEWMEKMVMDDQKRGQMKWAVQEAKRLQANGKEVPKYMSDFVVEEAKWANRWAACKAAQLRQEGTEVPTWMVENARKGIMEYATEKAQLIEEQIEELEEEKAQETTLADSFGDPQLARKRMLVKSKQSKTLTLSQQEVSLQESIEELEAAEDEAKEAGYKGKANLRLKEAIRKAQDASAMLTLILNRKELNATKDEQNQAAMEQTQHRTGKTRHLSDTAQLSNTQAAERVKKAGKATEAAKAEAEKAAEVAKAEAVAKQAALSKELAAKAEADQAERAADEARTELNKELAARAEAEKAAEAARAEAEAKQAELNKELVAKAEADRAAEWAAEEARTELNKELAARAQAVMAAESARAAEAARAEAEAKQAELSKELATKAEAERAAERAAEEARTELSKVVGKVHAASDKLTGILNRKAQVINLEVQRIMAD